MPGIAGSVISNLVNRTKGLDEIHDDVSILDGIVDVPAKDSTDDVQMSDVVGKKDDTAVSAVGTTKSLVAYLKGILTDTIAIQTLHNVPTADVTTNAQARDVVGNKTDAAVTTVGTEKTLMAYLKGALNAVATVSGYHTVPTKDAATDAQMRDVVGKKDDTAVSVVGTTKTLVAYVKGIMNDLSNATDGLGALKTLIDTIGTSVEKPEIIMNSFDVNMGYWTEVDTPGRVEIDYTSNERINITDLDSDEDVYIYKVTDANVADFILDFEIQVLSTATGANTSFGLGLSDGVGTMKDVTNGLYVRIVHASVNTNYVYITHASAGSLGDSGSTGSLDDDTVYYGRLIRRGSYCWLGIYSDRKRETHIANSPIEHRDVTPVEFTHLFPMTAHDDGTTGKAMDASVESIKLISASDIDKYLCGHVM